MAEQQAAQRPPEGEETKQQLVTAGISGAVGGLALDAVGAIIRPGTYATYRLMRANPTIGLARIAATAPVRSATWGVRKSDDASDEQLEFVQDQLHWLWPRLVSDVMFALDYGWAPFEKVYEIRSVNGRMLYWLRKLKPLLVDKTTVQVDKDTGVFVGLMNQGVMLPAVKSFIYTYDGEAGNLYGRSRHENARKVWSQWEHLLTKEGQYVTKVAGVIPMIEYPPGKSRDASGREVDNHEMAKQLLANLGKGHGVYMPNTMAKYADELVRQGVDISQLKAWIISFLEAKGLHGKELTEMMRHTESLMFRAWLVPERAALEGQHGTLAEAEAHANLSLVIAELLLGEIVRYVNWYIVDALLELNYGPDTAGTVWMEPERLGEADKLFFRDLIKGVLINPNNVELLQSWVDIDALLDMTALPKSEETLDVLKGAEERADRLRAVGLTGLTLTHLAGTLAGAIKGE